MHWNIRKWCVSYLNCKKTKCTFCYIKNRSMCWDTETAETGRRQNCFCAIGHFQLTNFFLFFFFFFVFAVVMQDWGWWTVRPGNWRRLCADRESVCRFHTTVVSGNGVCSPQQNHSSGSEAGKHSMHHTWRQSHQNHRFWISKEIRPGQETAGNLL